MNKKITALMPMKHISERVPGKNFRKFANSYPLFLHMLKKLSTSESITEILINTDSKNIVDICGKEFGKLKIINRPNHLIGNDVPMNDILLHDISFSDAEFFLQTHSTNPLLQKETIEKSIKVFFDNYPTYDSLFSVSKIQTRFYDELARPVNHNPNILLKTQDLPPLFEENSCIYIFHKSSLIENKNRIGKRPFMFLTDDYESIDIDNEIDFSLAEQIYKLKNKINE